MRWGVLLLLVVSGIIAGTWWFTHQPAEPWAETAAVAAPSNAYVDNNLCLGCHKGQAQQWQGSHHAKAMAVPTAGTVRGNFSNTTFTHQGVTSRFFKRDARFFVNTDGPDGKLSDFEIAYTFGVEPLQQYLITLPGGRLQALQIAWDSRRLRWFHLLPKEKTGPGDVLHWTGRYQTANTMCIACHATAFEKRYSANTDSFDSRWAEPGVSCQACHGAGQQHVQWARQRAESKSVPEIAGKHTGLAFDLRTMNASQRSDLCAGCHSRRSDLVATPQPGKPLLDSYLPSLLNDGLYHADGQQSEEVFAYGSFRQSKMHASGVTCTDCHSAHTGKLKIAGNGVCLQCHAPKPHANPNFAGAIGNYETSAHHFHKQGSAGAQCAGCHMPSKNYMQIQPRPDHSIRIPRPDLSVKLGTPNACNNCHTNRSAQWAADRVVQWYGPTRQQSAHYGEVFSAARAGQPQANEALAHLAGDRLTPAIVRATALFALFNDSSTDIDGRIKATLDADPVVRASAADGLEATPAATRTAALTPLLGDPVRAVRIAAARSLSSLPRNQLDSSRLADFDAAVAEYIVAQSISLDMPGAHLNLAVLYQNIGRIDLAEAHYLDALRLDPDFTPARANLARLYNAASRNADAERVLVEGLKRMPDIGELQYSLGLLLAEQNRLPEAATVLAKATTLLPQRSRIQYNLGLTLLQLGRRQLAEKALLDAQALDPQDADPAYALATFYAQGGQREKAIEWAEKRLQLRPGDTQARQLLLQLRGN